MSDEQVILSVIVTTGNAANTIAEHRLIRSADADDALLEACARHVSNWDEHTADDHEAICDDGYYETGNKMICVIHLDENGTYLP